MSLYDLELTELDGSNVISSIALSQKLGRGHARVCAVIAIHQSAVYDCGRH